MLFGKNQAVDQRTSADQGERTGVGHHATTGPERKEHQGDSAQKIGRQELYTSVQGRRGKALSHSVGARLDTGTGGFIRCLLSFRLRDERQGLFCL